jgi:hypothetical protein
MNSADSKFIFHCLYQNTEQKITIKSFRNMEKYHSKESALHSQEKQIKERILQYSLVQAFYILDGEIYFSESHALLNALIQIIVTVRVSEWNVNIYVSAYVFELAVH